MSRHLTAAVALLVALIFVACDDEPADPPTVEITDGPDAVVHDSIAEFHFQCSADWCAYQCRVGDDDPQSCGSSVIIEDLDDGEHSLQVVAVDRAGSVSDPAHWQWDVDTSTAELDWVEPPHINAESATAHFDFECTDDSCEQFECAVYRPGDDPQFDDCTPPVDVDDVDSGRHIFEARSTDAPAYQGRLTYDFTFDPIGFEQVATGNSHTCAISEDQKLYCWGNNNYGQLGIGDDTSYTTYPRRVVTDDGDRAWADFTDIAVSSNHSCALREDGQLYCWGRNHRGQLGIGSTDDHSKPAAVTDSDAQRPWADWTHIATADDRSCGIRAGGQLHCWGSTNWSGLGTGDFPDTGQDALVVPTRVASSTGDAHWSDWTDVSVGPHHVCGIRAGGQLFCWGDGLDGRLGVGEIELDTDDTTEQPPAASLPDSLPGGMPEDLSDAEFDPDDTPPDLDDVMPSAEQPDGAIQRFGDTPDGIDEEMRRKLEAGEQVDPTSDPETFNAFREAVRESYYEEKEFRRMKGLDMPEDEAHPDELFDIMAGGLDPVQDDHDPREINEQLRTALGPTFNSSVEEDDTIVEFPKRVVGTDATGYLTDVTDVAAGHAHTCALRAGGALYCWGNNRNERLGIEGDQFQFTPAPLDAVEATWTSLTAGAFHTCALRAESTPWCWGHRADGRLGIAPDEGRDEAPVNPISLDDADDVAWTTTAAGNAHSCAITEDAELYCWGNNRHGQLGDDSTDRRVSPTAVVQP